MKKNNIMKKILTIISVLLYFTSSSQWYGTYWTANDINGNSHNLQTYINEGKTVLVDISAHWCGPCYAFHQSHAMSYLHHDFGPDGTDELMAIFTDVDANSSLALLQGGSGSQGDFLTGTLCPIIGPNSQGTLVDAHYNTPGVPTLYLHCGNLAPEISVNYDWWSLFTTVKSSCPSAFNFSGVDATLLKHHGIAGCPSGYMVEVDLYNASSNTDLQSAIIELRNPSGQLIATENWTGNLSPHSRTTVTINHIVSIAGVYSARVVNPNGTTDTRTNGDEEDIYVDFGYDNAYWASPISINVSGDNTTSWYLKNSSGGVEASGYGGASNYPANINPNECYTLLIINGDGQTYSIIDGASNTCADGIASGVEHESNFSAGTDPWNSLENIPYNINVFPVPSDDLLNVNGDYDAIIISDILGKIVLESNDKSSVIDVSDINVGTYLLEIIVKDKVYSKKIQISR